MGKLTNVRERLDYCFSLTAGEPFELGGSDRSAVITHVAMPRQSCAADTLVIVSTIAEGREPRPAFQCPAELLMRTFETSTDSALADTLEDVVSYLRSTHAGDREADRLLREISLVLPRRVLHGERIQGVAYRLMRAILVPPGFRLLATTRPESKAKLFVRGLFSRDIS